MDIATQLNRFFTWTVDQALWELVRYLSPLPASVKYVAHIRYEVMCNALMYGSGMFRSLDEVHRFLEELGVQRGVLRLAPAGPEGTLDEVRLCSPASVSERTTRVPMGPALDKVRGYIPQDA